MKPTPKPTVDRARIEAMVREALGRQPGAGAGAARARWSPPARCC